MSWMTFNGRFADFYPMGFRNIEKGQNMRMLAPVRIY